VNVLIVDTSSWISYFRNQKNDDLDLALQEGRVYLPSIVIAELLSGKMKNDQRAKLQDFLGELPICQNDFNHWVRVGELRAALLSEGYSISTPDAHVAQCALDLNGYLLSEDLIFQKISKHASLKMFN
jgi:predicted nucleic acid-binding protein